MAIFNAGKVAEWLKDWTKSHGKNKAGAYNSQNKAKKDESSQKKKGLLTEQDINNAIALIKQVIGENSVVGKYLDIDSAKEIMNDYSTSKYDDVLIATLYTMDPDDADNKDVLIPHEDASWYDPSKHDGIEDRVRGTIDKLFKKLNKECEKKYGDSFEFTVDSSYYAEYYYICSKKPKEASDDK